VATYAYVNPIVAVLLGWALLGEDVTPQILIAGAAIVVSVALIVGTSGKSTEPGRGLRRRGVGGSALGSQRAADSRVGSGS
jgi:hypothetical protein